MQHHVHRDGDEPDDGEAEPRRDDRRPEPTRGAPAGAGGQDGDDEHAEGGEQEARHDRGAVEHAARDVVEGAEVGEVQLPPHRIACREDRDGDTPDERGHRATAEVVHGVCGHRRAGRAAGVCDALAFGRGEEGQRTHVLCVRLSPKTPTPQSRTPRRSSRYAYGIPRSAANRWAPWYCPERENPQGGLQRGAVLNGVPPQNPRLAGARRLPRSVRYPGPVGSGHCACAQVGL